MALLNKLFFPSAPVPTPTTTSVQASTNIVTSNTAAVPSASITVAASLRAAATTTTTQNTSIVAGKLNQNTAQSRNYLSHFPFDGRQVRVLLYKEDDSRGRRLLFDSNALQKVTLKSSTRPDEKQTTTTTANATTTTAATTSSSGSNAGKDVAHGGHGRKQSQPTSKAHSTNFIDVCPEYGYKHTRPTSTDITPIGEMVFGSLAMSFRGTALKVHWLPEPARILCSQVYLTPTHSSVAGGTGSHSPYSTLSITSLLATPRTSISSEHGSIDGLSMNSFSMPFSVSVGRQASLTPSDRTSYMTSPLDVPDLQSLSINSADSSSGPRYSSTYSNATDSGYSGMSSSRGGASSDQWSYQYSTRSSLGSVLSDESDPVRKLSMDSAFFPSSPHLDEFASDGCLQRRISRNLRTSFEYEHSMNDLIGFLSDNYTCGQPGAAVTGGSEGSSMGAPPNYRRASYSANESRSNPEMGKRVGGVKPNSKRAKLGLAVCITMSESFEEEMELFCSEHIALLESMLSRLRASSERAYINYQSFLQIMFQAWQDAQQWFNDLFTAPRIKTPVWLSITTSGSKYSKTVAERFVKELCWLLSFADTKDTNFFISTMLTAILTYHLGWVATVSAFNSSTSKRSEASAAAIEQRAKLQQVAQKHPYNALWAQLGDLYGAIGIPPKLVRTVIYGTEKLSVEKLLSVLTYFIRCGEVRRAAKREDFNKDLINSLACQNSNDKVKRNSISSHALSKAAAAMTSTKTPAVNGQPAGFAGAGYCGGGGGVGGGGMTRTQTCKQNLNTISDNCQESSNDEEEASSPEDIEFISTLKKNEIPTVLAFRDSRFVQQELRIGNYLMDTGIEKKSLLMRQVKKQQLAKLAKDGRIRLTITTPDNVELCVEDDSNASTGTGSIDDGAIEALDYEAVEAINQNPAVPLNKDQQQQQQQLTSKKNFFWNMVPVKEGLSLFDLEKLHQGVRMINRKLDRRSSSFSVDTEASHGDSIGDDLLEQQRRASHLSLSDLITQNSMGKGDRMTWGIEPIKENVSLEEQIHFDLCQKLIERDHGISRQTDENNGVVFVLGDNEPLINLKKSTEDLAVDLQQTRDAAAKPVLCTLHQRTHDASTHAKKHSGMKFNFEQYPQIATNYMRSKNLVMSNYELLMDKASKLEANEALLKSSDSNATLNQQHQQQQQHLQQVERATSSASSSTVADSTSSESCVVCNSILSSYQTPSNATELEFETDEVHCYQTSTTTIAAAAATIGVRPLHMVSSAASIDTLKSSPHVNELIAMSAKEEESEISAAASTECMGSNNNLSNTISYTRKLTKRVPSQRGSISSVATKCAAVNEAQQMLKLPVPGVKELPQEDEPPGEKLRAGFIPSLFLNVNDHYVSDMVLQGTCASPNKWEMNLREDLALSAHSASLISQPAENLAIVADMEKWDVRLISSQAQHFPYAGGQSSPVGMSQLVSTMLETVQAMNAGGIAAYDCLSYLESKLQEIYLQSETLASFLLETDFCPLSAVTTALHLSENDVPLLLSIASIHTPKISRKCGISFR